MHSPQLCLISGREILILLSLPQPHLSEPHLRYPPDSSTEPQKSSVVFFNGKFAPRDLRTLCQDNHHHPKGVIKEEEARINVQSLLQQEAEQTPAVSKGKVSPSD